MKILFLGDVKRSAIRRNFPQIGCGLLFCSIPKLVASAMLLVLTGMFYNTFAQMQELPLPNIKPFGSVNPDYEYAQNPEGPMVVHHDAAGDTYTLYSRNNLRLSKISAGNRTGFQWTHTFSSGGGNASWAVPFSSSNGNINFIGQHVGTNVDFDPGAGTSVFSPADDIMWLQYAPDGKFVFARKLTENKVSQYMYCGGAATDQQGNVYVLSVLYQGGSKDFDPGVGEVIYTSTWNNLPVLAKYSSGGALIWAKKWPYSLQYTRVKRMRIVNNKIFFVTEHGEAVNADPDGSVIVSGSNNILVARYNLDGQLEKAFSVGGDKTDWSGDFHVYPNNEILLTGYFSGATDLDPSAQVFNFPTNVHAYTSYIARYSADGALLSANRLSHGGELQIASLLVAPDGSQIWVGGAVAPEQTQFYSKNKVSTGWLTRPGTKGFVFNYSNDFGLKYAFLYGASGYPSESHINNLFFTPDKKLAMFGTYKGTVDIDPTSATHYLTSTRFISESFGAFFCDVFAAPVPSNAWPGYVKQGVNDVTFGVKPVEGATGYTWELPAGFTIVGNSNTNTIKINVNATAVSGTITVAANNACGAGLPYSFPISTGTKEAADINFGDLAKTFGDQAFALRTSLNDITGITYEKLDDPNDVISLVNNIVGINKAGSVKLIARSPDNATYGAGTREFTLTIDKRRLKVTAGNKNKIVGEENPPLTFTYEPVGSIKGNALHFDGVNDVVKVPYGADIQAISNSLTVEAWVKLPNANAEHRIVSVNNMGAGGFTFGMSGGKIWPYISLNDNTFQALLAGAVPSNTWTHIAFTYQAGEGIVGYINGKEVGRSPIYTSPIKSNSSTTEIIIGEYSGTFTSGAIDEIRIWDVARTAAQIDNNKNTTIDVNSTGLVSYYKFDQGIASGTNSDLVKLVDAKGYHGTLNGFVLANTTSNWVEGAVSLSLNEINTPPAISTIATKDSNPGNYDITIIGGSDENFDFEYVKGTLTIEPKTAQVTVTSKTVGYNGKEQSVVVSTIPEGLPVTVTYNGSAALPVDFGVYAVDAVVNDIIYAGTASGTLTINKGSQVITFDLPGKTYGDKPFTLEAITTSGLSIGYASSDPETASIVDNVVTIHKAGNVTITASQDGDNNYEPATPVSQTLWISKASQTITFNAIPDKKLSDGSFTLTATSTSGLPISYVSSHPDIASINGNVITLHKAGKIAIAANQAGNESYEPATQVPQTLTIKNNQLITFAALPDRALGEAPFALNATSNSGLPVTYQSSNTDVATINDNMVTLLAEGTTTITASQVGNQEFSEAAVNQTLVVKLVTGAETVGDSHIAIYPNPVNEVLIVKGIFSEKIKVEILDAAGRIVSDKTKSTDLSGGNLTLDVRHLKPGMYYLKISTDKEIISRQIVKK